MTLIIESILLGFGIYSILLSLFLNRLEKWNTELIKSFDNLACIIFSIGGLLIIGQLLIESFYSITHTQDEYRPFKLINNFHGPYILTNWIQPISLLILTQLLWLKKIKRNRFIRFAIGIILILPYEKLVIIITSLHRDYLPSSWNMKSDSNIIFDWAIYLFVFVLIVGVVSILLRTIKRLTFLRK